MRRESGFALVWALFLVVMAGALSAVLLQRDQTMRSADRTDLEALASFHAAEGGLAHARHALDEDPTWSGDTFTIGVCEVVVEVTPAGDDAWQVVSCARPGGQRVRATLRSSEGLPDIDGWQAP